MDYARFGRQIALPELRVAGQSLLGAVPVRFEPAGTSAEDRYARAGGLVAVDADLAVAVPNDGVGATSWACVEAARRVLGQPAREMPDGLRARLGGR